MQQKQENVRQIGLLQNDTSVCVSKSVLFKHIMKMCVSVHLSCCSSLCNFNTNILWNVVLTQLSEDV